MAVTPRRSAAATTVAFDRSQGHVGVTRHQLSDPYPLTERHVIDGDVATRDIGEEQGLDPGPHALADEERRLRDHERRDDQLAGERPQQSQGPAVELIGLVDEREQRSRVDDQLFSPKR